MGITNKHLLLGIALLSLINLLGGWIFWLGEQKNARQVQALDRRVDSLETTLKGDLERETSAIGQRIESLALKIARANRTLEGKVPREDLEPLVGEVELLRHHLKELVHSAGSWASDLRLLESAFHKLRVRVETLARAENPMPEVLGDPDG